MPEYPQTKCHTRKDTFLGLDFLLFHLVKRHAKLTLKNENSLGYHFVCGNSGILKDVTSNKSLSGRNVVRRMLVKRTQGFPNLFEAVTLTLQSPFQKITMTYRAYFCKKETSYLTNFRQCQILRYNDAHGCNPIEFSRTLISYHDWLSLFDKLKITPKNHNTKQQNFNWNSAIQAMCPLTLNCRKTESSAVPLQDYIFHLPHDSNEKHYLITHYIST